MHIKDATHCAHSCVMSSKRIAENECERIAENERIAAIQREYGLMGLTYEDVQTYTKLSVHFPDPVAAMPYHDGRFPMLPKGTMPHEAYMKKLEDLVGKLETAKGLMGDTPEQRTLVNELRCELYAHLTNVRPIDAEAFFETLNALIDEESRLLTNVRIREVSNIMVKYAT
jgi:hypothetical protein